MVETIIRSEDRRENACATSGRSYCASRVFVARPGEGLASCQFRSRGRGEAEGCDGLQGQLHSIAVGVMDVETIIRKATKSAAKKTTSSQTSGFQKTCSQDFGNS